MGASTLKSYNTFVKGIITEAGPLTYPENASIDEENTVLNRDGSRQRRLGMDFEDLFVQHPVTLTADNAISSGLWNNVANSDKLDFAVVQAGTTLLVFDANGTPSTSASLVESIDLSAHISGDSPLEMQSGDGYLFLAEPGSDPLVLTYDPTDETIAVSKVEVKVRDYWGVDDTLAVDAQPTSLSSQHRYNLLNQGWPADKINAYNTGVSAYPSNAQQWFLGRKDADNTFDADQLKEMDFGTTPAPKGRFIISLFDRSGSREDLSGVAGLAADVDTSRPSTVAFAFQRLWLAGMQSTTPLPTTTSPNLTGMVLYSRVIRGPKDFGQMYTDADPTSETDSMLVDTDGGYVIIPDSGKIHRIVSVGASVAVFAENGVWEIRGGNAGFTAADHQVIKVSAFGALAPGAVVAVESDVLYWNKGGIYHLTQDENGFLISRNITENSIQTLYNALDQDVKRNAVGAYDPVNRKVMWLYNDQRPEDYSGLPYRNRYTKELVLDLVLQAWTKNRISVLDMPEAPHVAGYIEMPDFLLRKEGVRSRGDSVTKYVVVQFLDPLVSELGVSFGYYRSQTFRDWFTYNGVGVPFESFLLTGYEIMGDTTRPKQTPYIVTHCKRTEMVAVDDGAGNAVPDNPSGLYMQARWEWTSTGTAGRWSDVQQVYRLLRPMNLVIGQPIDYSYDVITTKSRVRGSGTALSLRFTSDGDKDFYLYGWATKFTGREHV